MKLLSKSATETKDIGFRLGKKLKAGDIVYLYGELGTGKTTMVKGIASAFDINERDITSASFTIIAEYETPVPFYHIDLYRVSGDEVSDLGLNEYLGSDGVSVIEWAERVEGEVSAPGIKVKLLYSGEGERQILIEGTDL